MKALVYHGPGQKAWEEVPDAAIQGPADVVVKVDTTTICGTDLHILQGDVAAVTDGRILGHEAVGMITEVGEAVKGFQIGDRVLVPAITKCGRCEYCQRGMPSHCQTVGGIGWIFGHLIDGTQAESVRVPYADTSLYAVPDSVTNEQAIFLADSLPTGYEVGVLAGQVRPGGTIANIGVHGMPVELPMQDMWIQNVTLTMGLVDTVSIPTLLKMVASGRIPAEKMGTHTFTFDQIDEAYDVFKNAAANSALKVVITPA